MREASIAGPTQPTFEPRRSRPLPSLTTCCEWLAFFLVVAGVRLWIVASFGSAMPLLDQWDDEGARLLKPYAEGTLGFSQLFAPHNEHRPVLARLIALGLFVLNQQWDARLQMLVNAIIAALLTCVVAFLGVRLVASQHRRLVLAAVACASCLPYAWENTTWAFQSSFYFLGGFSVLAIWGLLRYPPLSAAWIGGAVAALLACVSMGSGFLCAAAVLAVVALKVCAARLRARECVATVVLCAGLIALGLALRPHVPDHDVLRATSTLQWLAVFARCLSWPYPQFSAGCVLMYLPVAALTLWWWRRRDAAAERQRSAETILGLAAWVALQAAAIAYARGGGLSESYIAPRYTGILTLGVVANLLALFSLAESRWLACDAARLARSLGAAWIAAAFIGIASVSYKGFAQMRARADQLREAETHLRTYLVTHDPAELRDDSSQIAYPWHDRLATLLDDPTIRRILPAAIRPPLDLEPEGATVAFTERAGVWSSEAAASPRAGAEMRTQVLRPALPYLRFELRGALGKGISLRVRDERSGELRSIEFTRSRDWRIGYVAVSGPARVIARDENPQRSVMFTNPIEVGRLSFYAEVVLANSFYILVAAIAIVVILAAHHRLTAEV